MINFSRLSIVFVLFCSLFFAFPLSANAMSVDIDVEAQTTKASGKNWDILKGSPDIAICITNPQGTICYPEGSDDEFIVEPECPDSFQCSFKDVVTGQENVKISIIDVDVVINDTIGVGYCNVGETCDIGQAKITVKSQQEDSGWFW